jgi:hypothetical protein
LHHNLNYFCAHLPISQQTINQYTRNRTHLIQEHNSWESEIIRKQCYYVTQLLMSDSPPDLK